MRGLALAIAPTLCGTGLDVGGLCGNGMCQRLGENLPGCPAVGRPALFSLMCRTFPSSLILYLLEMIVWKKPPLISLFCMQRNLSVRGITANFRIWSDPPPVYFMLLAWFCWTAQAPTSRSLTDLLNGRKRLNWMAYRIFIKSMIMFIVRSSPARKTWQHYIIMVSGLS